MLSKSKIMAFRQCPKRLWLEINTSLQSEVSAATQASFDVGHQFGEIAHQLYDPENKGQVIDPRTEGYNEAFVRSAALLAKSNPIFEAGFSANGTMAFADVMLPMRRSGKKFGT